MIQSKVQKLPPVVIFPVKMPSGSRTVMIFLLGHKRKLLLPWLLHARLFLKDKDANVTLKFRKAIQSKSRRDLLLGVFGVAVVLE